MEQKLCKLDWDSDFFNFNVSRIEGLIQKGQDIRNIEFLMKENNIKLSYYSTSKELPSYIFETEKFDIVLVDKKTTYCKEINPDLRIHKSITSINKNTSRKGKLIDLAIQSGVYSRFNVDKRISKE